MYNAYSFNNYTMLMKFWVAFCLASNAVMAVCNVQKPHYDLEDSENLFRSFIHQHGKEYNGKEYFERLEIFKESLKDINFRNEKYPLTVFAVNNFSYLTPEELNLYRGDVPSSNLTENKTTTRFRPNVVSDEVAEFDWRKSGVITPVKDQGNCSSGYIFAVIAYIEARYAMENRQCLAFSESQLLDCCNHSKGCKGGSSMDMFGLMDDYILQNMGFMLEKDYPYYPEQQACHYDKRKAVPRPPEYATLVRITDEDDLTPIVVNFGPPAICLNAADFKHYSGGILEPDLCTGKPLDHCVLLVGYGEENGKQFWIIKNSYGVTWGEKGFVRLRRGVKACGIADDKYPFKVLSPYAEAD